MTTPNSKSSRTFLGRQIQRLREENGWTRARLARDVMVSESLVRAWERGRRIPQPDDLARLDEIFGTRGILAAIRNDLVSAAAPMEWLGEWMTVEACATSLWSCESVVVPGLLQTQDYARAILQAADHLEDTEEMVTARMKRQHILAKEDRPMLVSLIAESVLWYNIGGEQTMCDQLLHLAQMAERDNVIIQVLPNRAPACAGLTGPFVIAGCNGGDGIAYIDNALSGQVIDDTDEIVRLRYIFDILRASALPIDDSIDLIGRVATQWISRQ